MEMLSAAWLTQAHRYPTQILIICRFKLDLKFPNQQKAVLACHAEVAFPDDAIRVTGGNHWSSKSQGIHA